MCSGEKSLSEVEGTVRNIEGFEQVDMYVMEKKGKTRKIRASRGTASKYEVNNLNLSKGASKRPTSTGHEGKASAPET